MTHIPDEAVQAAKLAAVKAYIEVEGKCRPVAMAAALTAALPYLSAPCAVEVDDGGLVNYLKKMQEAAANYIEPTTYKKRFPKDSSKHSTEFKIPHEHHADSQKRIEEARRDRAFIDDIIYFLDCPEERRILSCVVTKPVDVPALLQDVRNGERDGFINTGKEPHGNDADLSCPYCGGSGHKDDAKPVDVAAVREQCAVAAECAFDDRPRDRSGHHSHIDWEDGFRDGTRASATAIRALSAEPTQESHYKKALQRIVNLDEAMGHDLNESHAFEAVAIANKALATTNTEAGK